MPVNYWITATIALARVNRNLYCSLKFLQVKFCFKPNCHMASLDWRQRGTFLTKSVTWRSTSTRPRLTTPNNELVLSISYWKFNSFSLILDSNKMLKKVTTQIRKPNTHWMLVKTFLTKWWMNLLSSETSKWTSNTILWQNILISSTYHILSLYFSMSYKSWGKW